MKLPHLALAAAVLGGLALVPAVAAPQDTPVVEETGPSLAEGMGKLNRGLRQLRGVLKDDAAMLGKVDAVAEMQALVLEGKSIVPPKVAQMDDGDAKAEEIAAYRKEMNAFLRGLLDVEEAFLAGDGKAAKSHLQSLEKLKRSAHERFQERGR